MKRFTHLLVLLLLIAFSNSMYSQVKINLSKKTKYSIKDPFEITVDLTEIANQYSDEDIFGSNENEFRIELHFKGGFIRRIEYDDARSIEENHWKFKEVDFEVPARLIETTGVDYITLTRSPENKYLYTYTSSSTTADLFGMNSPEYLYNMNINVEYVNTNLNGDITGQKITDSESIFLHEGSEIDIVPFDKTLVPRDQLMYFSSPIKNNLTELIDETNKDLMYSDERFWQGQEPAWMIVEDFDNDNEKELLARIYNYYLGYEYERVLTDEEKSRLISRIALFDSEVVNDSVVYNIKWMYDEKSEGTDLHVIDYDHDGDLDVITKPDVFHGTEYNKPKYYGDMFHRPNFIYLNDGVGNFKVDSIDVKPNIQPTNLFQMDTDKDFELVYPYKEDWDKKVELIVRQLNEGVLSDNKIYFDFSTYFTENIASLKSIDVNSDGFKDLLILGASTDYVGETADVTIEDKRIYSIVVVYSSNGIINPTLENTKLLARFETPFMLGWEGDPMHLLESEEKNLVILNLIRNGSYYGEQAGDTPSSVLKAFEISNNSLTDVSETVFPNGLNKSYFSLPNQPKIVDVNNDGLKDICWSTSDWNLDASRNYSIPIILNKGAYFEPRYLANFQNYSGFWMEDIDSDGSVDASLALHQTRIYGIEDRWDNVSTWYNVVVDDMDLDGVIDSDDNCPNTYNPNQEDSDGDGIGDVCDKLADTYESNVVSSTNSVIEISSETMQKIEELGFNYESSNYAWFSSRNFSENFDFNNDGLKDIIIVFGKNPEIGSPMTILFWNESKNKYIEDPNYFKFIQGDHMFYGDTVYDFDGDGDLDIYFPVENYHGIDGNQPSYYFEGDYFMPATVLINNGNGFDSFFVDETTIDHGSRTGYPAYWAASLIDYNEDNIKDLIVPSIYQHPENNGYLATWYKFDEQGNVSKEFVFPWESQERYAGQTHSMIFKNYNDKIYAFLQPTEDFASEDNPYGYTYPEVWVYNKAIGNNPPELISKIPLNRDKSLLDHGSIINHDTFYIDDINKDGNEEIIIGMFNLPMSEEHFSVHVFNNKGVEITRDWFNNEEYLDHTGAHGNGFDFIDINNDNYYDIVFRDAFNSSSKDISILLNTGNKFVKSIIDTGDISEGFVIPIDKNRDGKYEFLKLVNKSSDINQSVYLYEVNYSFNADFDNDEVIDSIDNCPVISNPNQEDSDEDGVGDFCDNCSNTPNLSQEDADGDGIGNACDDDDDNDGVIDSLDNCPNRYNPDQSDINNDGIGDYCDPLFDNDQDGVINQDDNCIDYWNANLGITSSNGIDFSDLKQRDQDEDGVGDLCDEDFIILTIQENARIGTTIEFKEFLPTDYSNLSVGEGFPVDTFIIDDNNLKLIKNLNFNEQNIYDLKINYDSQSFGPKNIVVHIGFSLKEKTVQATKEESEYLSSKFNKYTIYEPWIEDVSSSQLLNFGGVYFGGDMSNFSMYDIGLNQDINSDGNLDLVFTNKKGFINGYLIGLGTHISNSPVYFRNNGEFNFTIYENAFENKSIIDGNDYSISIDIDGDQINEIIKVSEHYHIDYVPYNNTLIEAWLKNKNIFKNIRYDSNYNHKPTYYKLNENNEFVDMFDKIDFTGYEDVFFDMFQSAAGDIDNDGDNDIVFGAKIHKIDPTIGGSALCILRNDGNGNLKFELYKDENLVNGIFDTSEGRMVIEDLNGDGFKDLIYNISSEGDAGKLAYLENDGTGKFIYKLDNIIEDLPQGMRNGYSYDIENDGKTEIIIFNSSGNGANGYEQAGPPNLIKIYNFNNFVFEDVTSKYFYENQNELDFYSQFISLKLIDLDSDGFNDLVPKFLLEPDDQGYDYPENAYYGDWNNSKGFQFFRYDKNHNKFQIIDLGEIDRNDIDSGTNKFYYNYNDYDFADLDNDGEIEFYRLKMGVSYHEGIDQKLLSGLMIYDFKESLKDLDGDGVLNEFDQCPNTPEGALVDTNGCELFNLPQDNYSVEVTSATCVDSNNGAITMSAQAHQYNYNVTISGQDSFTLSTDNEHSSTLSNLPAGNYEICFTVEGEDNYQQCYSVQIGEPQPLSASSKVNYSSRTVNLSMDGSELYTVTVNGKSMVTTDSSINVDLKAGMNTIEISTDLDCQGSYFEEIFVSEEVLAYPNPTTDYVQIYVGGVDTATTMILTDVSGYQYFVKEVAIPQNRVIELNLSDYPTGMYFIRLGGTTVQSNLKVIKE